MKSLAPSQRSLQSPWHRLLLMSARTSGRAHVTVQHQKQTSLTEITIKTTSALFGYACSKSLSSDRFADFSVTADLDPVVLKLSPSGLTPTVFKRTPNTQEVSTSLQLTPLTKRDNGGCFTQTVNSRSLQSAAEALHFNEGSFPTGNHFSADAGFDTANLTTFEPGKSLEERQFDSCYQWQERNHELRQCAILLSGKPAIQMVHDRLDSECVRAAGRISGGFSVAESWTTGNTYPCNSGPHETFCVWYNTAHTAYTVRNTLRNRCTGYAPDNYGPDYVMFSTNIGNKGGHCYCVVGTCRSQGENYWDKSGRAGGL
ncbi:hypothetical protein CNMCM8980_000928 [Aspergillus fumigatiaffinis]|uniref:Uncharacterized protein n=1 Tax=Aspergillus fumigatiaffinis TaxID=340414 RepID=A0A8H4EFL2_9EURO|nr:hypothetical protein CNMCM5878_008675 [Aspergillus fumigatiaffinis]KAF4219302.1 hypothetical protein CNMCM6457_003098 [Aspergillus fumigatiaffinis]KAF4241349.1 hypothetical protein CNMCM8980_000928 [Aspergillus fumigatiaffinis]KAF4242631.1 hypothetical protein CNMCM6805_002703 [Aspergillus fumigatiaffinis]